jgi:hypothetical protein
MTTITVQLKGKPDDLKDALVWAVHYYSAKKIVKNLLTLTYIWEEKNFDKAFEGTQDCISLDELDKFDIELVSIG